MRVTADDLRAVKWRGAELQLNPMGKWEAGVHYEDAWGALAEQINELAAARSTYADEIGALVRLFVAGPPVFPPGSAAAGSATEDRAVERWRHDLIRRAEAALNRADRNNEGHAVALSISNTLRSDRLVDQPTAVLTRVLR